MPPGSTYLLNCSVDGGKTFSNCGGSVTELPQATSYFANHAQIGTSGFDYTGGLTLADGSPCGIQNEFFNVRQNGTATLLRSTGLPIGLPYPVDDRGNFTVPLNTKAAALRLNCAGAPAIYVALNGAGGDIGTSVENGVTPPAIQSMVATLSSSSMGLFLPPPSGLPSDILNRSDAYLAAKGLDTTKGAVNTTKR